MINSTNSYLNVDGIADLPPLSSKIDKFLYTIITTMLVIIPIFVFPHESTLVSPSLLGDPFGAGKKIDVFSFYNSIFLIIGSFLLLGGLLFKIILGKFVLKNSKFNYLIMGLFLILILSTFLSVNKHFALFGFYERYEGSISYFCYFVVFFVLLNIELSRKQIIGVILCLIPFLFINLLLGISNLFDLTLLQEGFINYLNIGSKVFSKDSKLITTLYNPNYASGAASVLFALFFSLMLFLRNKIQKFLIFILALLSVILIIISTSFGGTLLFLIFFPLIIFSIFWHESKLRMINILLIFAFIITSSIALFLLANYSEGVWQNTVGPFIGEKSSKQTIIPNNNINTIKKSPSIPLEKDDSDLEFKNKSIHSVYKLPELPKPGIGAGNGRVYIWKETLKVFVKHPILGTGLETLPLLFNQNEPQKVANLNTEHLVILNPHSTYLAWLYGGGALTLLGFLIFILTMGIDFVKNIYRRTNNVIIISFGFAIMAYFMQAAFNDTRLGSSFIIWVLIGVFCNQLFASRSVKKIIDTELPQ